MPNYKTDKNRKEQNKNKNTLVEVLLSNRPELFQCAGNYYPCLSDHALIYGILKNNVNPTRSKVISFRSYKNFDPEDYKQLLSLVPWHVRQLFDEIDDHVHVCCLLMNNILSKVAPVKRMRVRDKDVLYMISDWKSAIRAKRKVACRAGVIWGCILVYRYTKERNIKELRHNPTYEYENNRNSPVYRYTRTAPNFGVLVLCNFITNIMAAIFDLNGSGRLGRG